MEEAKKFLESAFPIAIQAQKPNEDWSIETFEAIQTDELHSAASRPKKTKESSDLAIIGVGIVAISFLCIFFMVQPKTFGTSDHSNFSDFSYSPTPISDFHEFSNAPIWKGYRARPSYSNSFVDSDRDEDRPRKDSNWDKFEYLRMLVLHTNIGTFTGTNVTNSNEATILESIEDDFNDKRILNAGSKIARQLCKKSNKPNNLRFTTQIASNLWRISKPLLTEGYSLNEFNLNRWWFNPCLAAKKNTRCGQDSLYCLNGKPNTIPELRKMLRAARWAAFEMEKTNSNFVHVRNMDLLSRSLYF
eukprot:GHVP01066950.1.p1 GENE.GHVP01066950.1~~GHVP01066950.1.p1  ORF type:complete len:310 (+),score=37.56 GHVP01066950.1:23-931(+)